MKKRLCGLLAFILLLVLILGVTVRADGEPLKSSQAFIEILKKREGFEKYPYKDNTQWSVGYGTRCPDDKLEYYKANGITEEEAEALMLKMLASFEASVHKFANKHNLTLTQNQFDALVSFTYNCGDSWTTSSSGNMYRAVKEQWQGSDFLYAICLWSKSAGEYILINRRMYEANMYINGIYETPYNHDTGYFRYIFLEPGQGKLSYVIHGYDIRDPKPIKYNFTKLPTGKDSSGNSFTYEFDGWYTAPENGRKVEVLDDSLTSGSLLYAMWKDPQGNVVYLPVGEECSPAMDVTATGTVNIRSGPGTHYSKQGKLPKGTTVTLTRVYIDGSTRWGQYADGWISLAYTNYDEVLSGLQVWPRTGVVNANGVNVRNGAGTSNDKMYQLNKGDPVTIYAQDYANGMYWGKLADGNWISLTYVNLDGVELEPEPEPEPKPEQKPDPEPEPGPAAPAQSADVNGSGGIDKDDAIYLLRHVVYPEKYPITVNCDVNGSNGIDKDDAIYLLRHVVYPEKYPLKFGE